MNTEKVIDTDVDSLNGQNKCPKCGATDISQSKKSGLLRCNFCRYEFAPVAVSGIEDDIAKLSGKIVASGAAKIDGEASDMITIECTSCGSEVVINTNETNQCRCHWCRNMLSLNKTVPNGAVPDVVLPFKIEKSVAEASIQSFVKKRQFFANAKFKSEFTTDNILGVYLPYMVVDVNAHMSFSGQGEHETRSYTRGTDENKKRYYDAELYNVSRDFDIAISDLTIESNIEKLDYHNGSKTNNIINAIMPFDIENALKWDANYLRGYSSEKRNVDIEAIEPIMKRQSLDIGRHRMNETLEHYDRGVRWDAENIDVVGEQWVAAYLPVWLYSYQQVSGNKKVLHYVAVNARTNETMGSVPVDKLKLFLVSFIVEIFAFLGMIFVEFEYDFLFLVAGFIYYFIIYNKYRNKSARHYYEKETVSNYSNLKSGDEYVKELKGLRDSYMVGANNKDVGLAETIFNSIK